MAAQESARGAEWGSGTQLLARTTWNTSQPEKWSPGSRRVVGGPRGVMPSEGVRRRGCVLCDPTCNRASGTRRPGGRSGVGIGGVQGTVGGGGEAS